MRPMMSAPPPGPNGTIMRTGRCGQSCAAASPAPKSDAAETASRLRRVSISVPPSARGGEPSDARPSFMTWPMSWPMSRPSNFLIQASCRAGHEGRAQPAQRRTLGLILFFSPFWKIAPTHRIADGGGRVEGPQFFQHVVEHALDLVQAVQDQREIVVRGHDFTGSEEEAPAGGDGGHARPGPQSAERIELGLFTLRRWEKCAVSLLLPHHLRADIA